MFVASPISSHCCQRYLSPSGSCRRKTKKDELKCGFQTNFKYERRSDLVATKTIAHPVFWSNVAGHKKLTLAHTQTVNNCEIYWGKKRLFVKENVITSCTKNNYLLLKTFKFLNNAPCRRKNNVVLFDCKYTPTRVRSNAFNKNHLSKFFFSIF